MNEKFVREVLRLLPEFAVAGKNFFYERPFDHILAGFAWEAPRHLYIWKYAFPIFEDCPIHLSYGSRLPRPNDSMTLEKGREAEMAQKFVRRISSFRDTISKLRELDCFLEYLESRKEGFTNPVIRQGYALALVMARRDSEALEQLNIVAQRARGHELEGCAKKWIDAIDAGVARRMLLSNEQQFMNRLGIQKASD